MNGRRRRLASVWEPGRGWIWLLLAAVLGVSVATLPLSLAGLIVIGAVVVLAVLINPLFGLALTLIAGPFGALENVLLGGTAFDSGQLLLLLTLASWLAHSIARREILLPRGGRAITVALSVFVAVSAVSVLGAPSPADGLVELVKWIQIGLIAWLVMDTTRKQPEHLVWVVAAALVGGLVQAVIGVWQFGLRGHGPEHFEILGRFYRAYGTFEQPNPYAGFLGLALPLAAGWAWGVFMSQRWRHRAADRGLLIVLLASTAVLGLGLLMSWSRGGWLGAAAALAGMILFLPRRRWLGVALVIVLAVAVVGGLQAGLVPNSIAGRLTDFADYVTFRDARGVDITPENYAVLERMAHWQAALSMADQSPWLGIGFGNYAAGYSDHALVNWPYPLGHAHNYYLNLMAETGLLGLVAYLGLWATVFWLTIRVVARSDYPLRGLALGLLGIWVHLSVHHLVDKLYVNNIYLHLGTLLGILYCLLERPADDLKAPDLRIRVRFSPS